MPCAAVQLLHPSSQEIASCKATSTFSRALTHPDVPSLPRWLSQQFFLEQGGSCPTPQWVLLKNQCGIPRHPSPTPTPAIPQRIPFTKPHSPRGASPLSNRGKDYFFPHSHFLVVLQSCPGGLPPGILHCPHQCPPILTPRALGWLPGSNRLCPAPTTCFISLQDISSKSNNIISLRYISPRQGLCGFL